MTPEYKRHRQNYQLKKNYGISKEEYDLKLSLQNYACALCKTPVKTKALAVDHCHASGKVRDLLL
jgi:5-methylcytosine-specific restriction endonuclease McrA